MRLEDVFAPIGGIVSPFGKQLTPFRVTNKTSNRLDAIAHECEVKKVEVIRFALAYALENADWEDLANMRTMYQEIKRSY
ncbi:hypothetical protein [Streptosporangium jomthongense]|uniref:Uncharacterized protein n=1 Tax=Streptosporangium jomthongense TaxID=1193683 RepID=A0ABV8F0W3_9ACTN